ncbi:MAG: benzoate/H(+) symporter BenE family transporter [Deltaproteobacteria bacterium]|nr:benzoate/H(+) symporter BenE family transporter [Deltaproteobacteria bacterium]
MPSKQITKDISEPPVPHKSEKVYESFFASWLNKVEGNIKSLRINRQEISGSLGDMGTFIPLLVGMVSLNGLNIASALFFAGVFNVITGIAFGIPMAVQPMKAIATVAISEGLKVNEILTAGIVTGLVIFLFGITRIIEMFNRIIPLSVIRGLQLGIGLQLLIKGFSMVLNTKHFFGYDSISVGILSGVLVLLLFFSSRVPGAIVVFLLGLLFQFLKSPGLFSSLQFDLYIPHFISLTWDDFVNGALKAAIPQIPLTTLNSVIAVCALSWDLFPKQGAGTREVSISVGLMNLIGCWFGAMPMCHGAGGLAGQYRFGSRTGGSVVFLGLVKILLGLFLGGAALTILTSYPLSVLGVLLVFSGMELALVARDIKTKTDYFVMIITTAAIIAVSSTATGFVIGLTLSYLFYFGAFRIEKDYK